MSIEISLITSLLASVLGSSAAADALMDIYKKIFEKKTIDSSGIETGSVADQKILYLTPEKKSEIATDAALEALDVTYNSTLDIRNERMRQARLAFNVALSLMLIGVIIIFTGIALLWIKPDLAQGAVTVAAGAIVEIVSGLVFSFNKDANNRLEEVRKELSAIETARVGLSMAKQITDLEKRDNAIADLTKKVQNSG